MIYTTNKEKRWKLFEHYATRMVMNTEETALDTREFSEFVFLQHYFAPDYIQARTKPWLPNFFTGKV